MADGRDKARDSRRQADFVVRELFRARFGDTPYEPHRVMTGHRLHTAMKAFAELPCSDAERDRHLKLYMNDWDDPSFGGLARYLAVVLARLRVPSDE